MIIQESATLHNENHRDARDMSSLCSSHRGTMIHCLSYSHLNITPSNIRTPSVDTYKETYYDNLGFFSSDFVHYVWLMKWDLAEVDENWPSGGLFSDSVSSCACVSYCREVSLAHHWLKPMIAYSLWLVCRVGILMACFCPVTSMPYWYVFVYVSLYCTGD